MIRKTLFVAAALACAAGSAQAQKVGTYSGTADDGTFITFQVTNNGSAFFFGNGDVNMQLDCTHPVRTANEGWGFFLGQQIASGSNDFDSHNDYYDTRGTLHFTGPNTIKGTITSVTSVFVPGADPPIKAQFCKSPKQAFTLTFQNAPARRQHPTAAVLETRRAQ
jgi:hypothetical protein